MSSIIPGYNYDIFISYRQKDNKHDGWVSEFVDNLKGELESTFKEEISVYFDINPHDGLLETHDVDASLKDKLKCLVFIPIISRTYCDPKSFAWEHEFKAFVEQASQDQFGLKVKLPNGNVANRVMPIRIHDLDTEDVKFFEGITRSVMRTIDFVFKTASGVNRPLKSKEDHPVDNLNKIYYQDQINKVALAIKEIIQGINIVPAESLIESVHQRKPLEEVHKKEIKTGNGKSARLIKFKILSGAAILAVLIIVAVIVYPKIFKRNTLENLRSKGKISVVVMPFRNMTNDTTLNVWQDVIQVNLITFLSNDPEELKVRQTELVNKILQNKGLTNYNSITSSIASSISEKLDADAFINGSINKSGSKIRLNAQLIDSKTEDALKSFQIDGTAENILTLIDSLSVMVKNVLVISKMGKELSPELWHITSVNSPEAFRYFISGQNAYNERDWPTATKLYLQAIAVDSNITIASGMLSLAYLNQGMYDQAKKWAFKVYRKKDQMPLQQKLMANWIYAQCFETPQEQIKYIKQLLEIDDQSPNRHFILGLSYLNLYQYEKAIPEYEKALEIYYKWGIKPSYTGNYSHLGFLYHKLGQYKKEKKLYKKAEMDFPNNSDLTAEEAVLSLSEEDMIAANRYIDKYISICKDQSVPEASIMSSVAGIYSDGSNLEKAEEFYRKALSIEPENTWRMNYLAYFLVDKDRNLNEGIELVDKALIISPDNYEYLDTKGWGLYKQSKFNEAFEALQRSWDLRRKNAIYDHEAFLHLEKAKKAVANGKNFTGEH